MKGVLINITLIILSLCLVFHEIECQCSEANPCSFTGLGGDNLTQPTTLVSANGALTVDLTVDVGSVTIEWLTLRRRLYNGGLPGPTWRIKPGDVVTVRLVNNLMSPQKEEALNDMRLPNSTNIHVHGLHISSQAPQDNVFVHIPPGDGNTYVYDILDNHPSGTYWYHPHLHGSTMFQVTGGLAGMIIVEDPTTGTYAPPSHLAAVSCPNNCQHEVQLLFQPTLQYVNNLNRGFANIQRQIQDDDLFRHLSNINSGITLEAWLESNVNHYTTNGQIFPKLTITTGQIKRFRMVNAAGNALLELLIVDQNMMPTTGCTFKEISFDGIYLDSARTPALGKTLIPPSSKCDWLVVCNTAGVYQLRSMPEDADMQSTGNFQRLDDLLLTIEVTGSTTNTVLANDLPARQPFVSDFRNVAQSDVRGGFVVEAGPGFQLNRVRFANSTDFRFKSELNTVQEWYLTNADPTAGHPIHIHVNHFQVISYNQYTGPVASNNGPNTVYFNQNETLCEVQNPGVTMGQFPNNGLQYLGHNDRWAAGGPGTLGYVAAGEFRDVIVVPPLANITVRFRNDLFLGEVVTHCHILSHEDAGMMMTTEIVNPGDSLTANSETPAGYPGQCNRCDPIPFSISNDLCTTAGSSASFFWSHRSLWYVICTVISALTLQQL